MAFLVVGLIAGVTTGATVSYAVTRMLLLPQASLPTHPSHSVSPKAQQTLRAALDKSYVSAKKLIELDLKKGVLTQAQADMVTKKLDEAYAYRKTTIAITGSDVMRELNKKRLEWRTWSRNNGISVKYLVALR